MFKSDTARTLTAIAATILMSATCLAAAVGPATTAGKAPLTTAARLVA